MEGGLPPFTGGGRPRPRLGGRGRTVSGRVSLRGGSPAIAAHPGEVAGPVVARAADSADVETAEAADAEL